MRPHALPLFVAISAALLLVVVAVPRDAQADIVVGLDADYAMPTGDWNVEPDPGTGVALRLGYMLPLPFVSVTPGVFFRQQSFSSGSNGDADYTAYVGGAALRAGVSPPGMPFEPSVFVHLGYGTLEGEGPDYVITEEGLTVEVGGALDFTALPMIDIGLHGSYTTLSHADNPNPALPSESAWASFGLHVELMF